MKPGTTRNKLLTESKLKPSFIMSRSTKAIRKVDPEKAALIYLGAQGNFSTCIASWPLYDIAIPSFIWHMHCNKGGSGGYTILRNRVGDEGR